jgi:K(+)-stimulated pyrophosphate-energized sodium pump
LSVFRSRGDHTLNYVLAALFYFISVFFVWRSFYGMRIGGGDELARVGEMGASHAGD